MPYETFKRTTHRTELPKLTITPTGRIVLNAASARIAANSDIAYVSLLWDKSRRRLALKATSKTDKDGYSLTPATDSRNATMSATTFLRHIRWQASGRVVLEATWSASERMFEATLPTEYLGGGEGSVMSKKGKPESDIEDVMRSE